MSEQKKCCPWYPIETSERASFMFTFRFGVLARTRVPIESNSFASDPLDFDFYCIHRNVIPKNYNIWCGLFVLILSLSKRVQQPIERKKESLNETLFLCLFSFSYVIFIRRHTSFFFSSSFAFGTLYISKIQQFVVCIKFVSKEAGKNWPLHKYTT